MNEEEFELVKIEFNRLKSRLDEMDKKLDLVDTIATSTAIGTDTHPKRIEKLEAQRRLNLIRYLI